MDKEEQVETWFEELSEEYLKFERIPQNDRRHRRPDLCAFLYLDEKFGKSDDEGDFIQCSEHDEFWLCMGLEDIKEATREDVQYIVRCGVRLSDGMLCMFA